MRRCGRTREGKGTSFPDPHAGILTFQRALRRASGRQAGRLATDCWWAWGESSSSPPSLARPSLDASRQFFTRADGSRPPRAGHGTVVATDWPTDGGAHLHLPPPRGSRRTVRLTPRGYARRHHMALEFGTYRLRPRRVEEEGSRELHAALFVSLDGSIHPVIRFATTPVTHWTWMEVFENESTLWIHRP